MMILRVLIAVAVILQALSSFFPLLGNVLYKSGQAHIASGPAARMAPLWAATPWWQLAVWLLGVLLLLVAVVSGVVLYSPFMRKLDFGTVRRDRRTRLKSGHLCFQPRAKCPDQFFFQPSRILAGYPFRFWRWCAGDGGALSIGQRRWTIAARK